MDFWDLVRLLWRRWYVTAPMLVLTAFGATWVGTHVGPEYQATGHIAVVPAIVQRNQDDGPTSRINPWTEEALAHAAAIRLDGARLQQELEASGITGEWTAEVTGLLPVVTVIVVAPTAEQAVDIMHRLQTVVEEEVRERQEEYEIPAEEQIMTVQYDEGESVEITASRLRRVLVAVVGAGLVLTVAMVVGGDAIARWLAGRKRRTPPPDAGKGAAPRRRYPFGADLPMVVPAGSSPLATEPPGNGLAGRIFAGGHAGYEEAELEEEPISPAAPSAPEPAPAVARMVPDDATIVLPLANIPWAGRPNGDNGGQPAAEDDDDERVTDRSADAKPD